MRAKNDKIFLYLGIMFICSAIIILLYYMYLNYQSELIFKTNAENSIELATENNLEVNYYENTLESEPIEVLTADQKVKKVVKYKNVLKIPDLDIKAYIYEGTSQEVLRYGMGRYTSTKQLGELGNCAIAGHSSTTYNCILNGVENLPLYSNIYIWDSKGKKHKYYLLNRYVVLPTAIEVLQTTDISRSYLTIITCTDNGQRRLVLDCVEMTQKELEKYKADKEKKIAQELLSVANSDIFMFELYDFLNRVKRGR